MAKIMPFRGIRPAKELARRTAALPYDVYDRREARQEAQKDPLSFLNIDRPETQFPEGQDMYAPQVYQKAAELLWSQVAQGIYRQDDQESYYIYELTMDGRSQTGLVACASIDDYLAGVIMKHENTRAQKEEDRIRHVDVCDAQTGPIFLAYRSDAAIGAAVERAKQTEAIFDFVSDDGIGHRGWAIREPEQVEWIREAFGRIERIYIADGHHRAASAVRVGLRRRALCPRHSGREPFNYFLSVLFPDDELMILDYNRVVKDLGGMSDDGFVDRLRRVGSVEMASSPVRPQAKGQIGLCLRTGWYLLTLDQTLIPEDAVGGLDVSALQDLVLGPILGIDDPRTDERIDFVGGIRGLEELERRVHTDCRAAFAMYPTSIRELFAVADDHRLMPPKSTWFEPKIRSGLFIHSLRDGEEEKD